MCVCVCVCVPAGGASSCSCQHAQQCCLQKKTTELKVTAESSSYLKGQDPSITDQSTLFLSFQEKLFFPSDFLSALPSLSPDLTLTFAAGDPSSDGFNALPGFPQVVNDWRTLTLKKHTMNLAQMSNDIQLCLSLEAELFHDFVAVCWFAVGEYCCSTSSTWQMY